MKIKNDKLLIQVTCLAVSIVLWMTVMIVTNPTFENPYTNVSLTIKNLSTLQNSNLIMMNQDKENITVTVKAKGLSEQLNKLSSRDFTAYIDVLGFSEGVRNAKVEVIAPNGVEVVSVYPSQIACNIEAIVSKVMDVSVQYEGSQAESYYKEGSLPNPSSVKITGPRSVVNSADLAVATINISNAKDTVVKTVPVRVYDDKDTEIFMSVPTGNVEVTVPIYPTKYVELKPTIIGEPEEGYELVSVTVKPERVKIAASRDILDTIKELTLDELDITDSYNNILTSKNILNTDGLILLDISTPPVVNTVVEKIIDKEIVYSLKDVQFTNKSENNDIIVDSTEEITITVTGTSSLVNSLKKDDLVLMADLANAAEGINTVKVDCITELEFKNIVISNELINVELIKAENTESPEE